MCCRRAMSLRFSRVSNSSFCLATRVRDLRASVDTEVVRRVDDKKRRGLNCTRRTMGGVGEGRTEAFAAAEVVAGLEELFVIIIVGR